MDSPSGRKPGSFHWASTMWHEMSHVYALTATEPSRAALVHRRPGGARRDRRLARLGRPPRTRRVIDAIKDKKLLPIAELDRGFIHPTAPAQVIVSYFQARHASATTSPRSGAGTSCWP